MGRLKRLVEPIASAMAPYQADAPLAAQFRARQIQAVLRLTPLTMLANVLNALIVGWTFRDDLNPLLLVGWALFVLYSAGAGLDAWLRWRRHRTPATASPRALTRSAKHAALLAILWGTVPLLMMPEANPDARVLLTAVVTGMICAGGFALATIPQAALTYVAILGAATVLGLIRMDLPQAYEMGLLLLLYTLIVMGTVISSARTFGARLMAEAEGEHQRQLIGLLLNDFEENASDWLWETDADGRLTHVSHRMATVFGRSVDALMGQDLLALIAQSLDRVPQDERQAYTDLCRRFNSGRPFREALVPIVLDGETRWWSLTAKPLTDGHQMSTGWRGVGTDVTQALAAQREVQRMAHFDGLTGLSNRNHFHESLSRIEEHAADSHTGALLLCLDLDNFKAINDSYGHSFGDGLLRVVAQRLLGRTRRTDIVARLGGDEFAIIRWGLNTPEDAEELASRIIASLADPFEVDGIRVKIGTSVGIAMAPKDGQSGDQLLKNADIALYAAKFDGKGRFRFFDYEMDTRARRRLFLEHELRGALQRGEFHLAYQPIFSLATGRICGCEALLRWRHPRLGLIDTQECISVAEDSGQIESIGEWVLNAAIRDAAGWPDSVRLSVNLSLAQFINPALCDTILTSLSEHGLPATRLELELTESIFLRDTTDTEGHLRALRAAGIRIALDDFGTGYSSLAYLRSLPLDRIKIDRAFVQAITTHPETAAIVRAIIAIAKALDMDTCAEGVEGGAQLTVLRAEGCDTVQGFALAEPMAPAALAAFLTGNITVPALVAASRSAAEKKIMRPQ
ncbi:putative bifunctional diguanylate cyclase/phosphodiesterase [Denitromonas ohlonensis]|uniref:EAL domain-containing protein n=3 Tax=Denitromonas TaxID=139331 RepID=A0A557RC23_9RHOO|nr:EAL domain-containing protein [Denitromonas ohlonensis]TVO62720.1 EAL domain-containing protein [Denitromonas ohlonensis]TVO78925.1 EAL domain-containing protein [Denitromonas ohlonensis]